MISSFFSRLQNGSASLGQDQLLWTQQELNNTLEQLNTALQQLRRKNVQLQQCEQEIQKLNEFNQVQPFAGAPFNHQRLP